MLALILSEAGFDVVTAQDGRAGLDRAWCERPALILTDLDMPDMDVIQMILGLRREPELQAITVLVISAAPPGLLSQAISAGAAESLEKPVAVRMLIDFIWQILGDAASQ